MKILYSLIIVLYAFSGNAQSLEKIIKFKLEFYNGQKRIELDKVKIEITQYKPYTDLLPGNNETISNDSLIYPPKTNLITQIQNDTIFMKKGAGSFRIKVTYENMVQKVEESFQYFEFGGRVVIGIINDQKRFRKKVYKKFKLLELYKEEKEKLHDVYPFLIVSENYGSQKFKRLFFIATKMNSEYENGTWWGTQVFSF